jgi:hypothetical protein
MENVIQMPEKKIRIPFPTPMSPQVDGNEVLVKESSEKWSQFELEDGTVMRIKPAVMSAIRIDGHYDQEGNPAYAVKAGQIISIVSSPEHLRKGSQGTKIH